MHILHHEDHKVEEFRDLARRRYGGAVTGPAEGEVFLHNVERVATLEAICHNPYHDLVFGNLSDLQLMRICVHHLMEKLDYRAAGKLLKEIQQLELAHARLRRCAPPDAAADTPEPAPTPEPARREIFKLDPEAQPVQPPPLTPTEVFLRGLSDRELMRRVEQANRFEAASKASRSGKIRSFAPEPHQGRPPSEPGHQQMGSGA